MEHESSMYVSNSESPGVSSKSIEANVSALESKFTLVIKNSSGLVETYVPLRNELAAISSLRY
jgi:hypothetical protein